MSRAGSGNGVLETVVVAANSLQGFGKRRMERVVEIEASQNVSETLQEVLRSFGRNRPTSSVPSAACHFKSTKTTSVFTPLQMKISNSPES